MTDAGGPLGPIMQILVPVSDVDRAAEFYEHVLGLPLLFRYPGNAFFDAAAFGCTSPDRPSPGTAAPRRSTSASRT
jgi:catechol 2,3-dioxygenase-like lactoylglutathione lyase family enzyme